MELLIRDSPRTPKLVVADAEAQANRHIIENKVSTKHVMEAYCVGLVPVLGLVVGGDIMMRALIRSPETRMVAEYASLDRKDLTEAEHVIAVMKVLEANVVFDPEVASRIHARECVESLHRDSLQPVSILL